MLRIQVLVTAAVAVIALLLAGLHAGISAVLGGASVVLGASAALVVAKCSENNKKVSAILINLLKAEATKILVIILLLIVIFKFYTQLVPFALIAGLAAAALFSGAALSRLKV